MRRGNGEFWVLFDGKKIGKNVGTSCRRIRSGEIALGSFRNFHSVTAEVQRRRAAGWEGINSRLTRVDQG
jgi:hypothetical protein